MKNSIDKQKNLTIVLTGGGTGGHVIPNISLIPDLKKHFSKIIYIGTKNSFEENLLKDSHDLEYKTITAEKFNRDKPLKIFTLPFKLLKSIREAKKILKEVKPNIIFSKGGFVSVPVVIAGWQLKIPIVSHESDLSFGLANKVIYKFCSKMCTSFPKTALGHKKAVYTGSPIRKELFTPNKEKGLSLVSIENSKPTILITGGSSGASSLNNIIQNNIKDLTKKYNIVHLVGKNKKKILNNAPKNYTQIEYCENIGDLFAIADLIISRAGSNAICELLALKKPMILIPLSNKATRGDQVDNAKYFEDLKVATVLQEENTTIGSLLCAIERTQKNRAQLIKAMSSTSLVQNSNQNILKIILSLLNPKLSF